MINKKGISPLVSTLFLIFFAVALGMIVMSWGKSVEAENAQPLTTCEGVSVSIVSVGDEPCYLDGKIKFTIENNGKSHVSGLRIFAIGDMIEKIESQELIAIADMIKIEEGISGKEIKTLKVTPSILTDTGIEYCPMNGVESDVKECS